MVKNKAKYSGSKKIFIKNIDFVIFCAIIKVSLPEYAIGFDKGKQMKLEDRLFLEALRASLINEKVNWNFEISMETWQAIFALAEAHKVLPLIFEAVYACPAVKCADEKFFSVMKRRCVSIMVLQIQKTAEFLKLYQHMQQQGMQPLVVKGIICRQLYPIPDLRVSADEDLLTEEHLFAETVEMLQAYGMKMVDEPTEIEKADEIGFLSENSVSYIELHKHLFSKTSEAYGDLNRYFKDAFSNCISLKVQGQEIKTLEPGTHLFYLICHAFKHFLHSGFGIRQVCDIVLFANKYGEQIDWQSMLRLCGEIRAGKFAAALFKIGKNYLNFDEEKACYPKEWRDIEVDEKNLLLELLGSGIYGGTTMSRRHSSNMTLEAVAAQNRGEKASNAVMKTLFPSVKSLEGKYHYLQKRPYLLPVAWSERLLKYHKEISSMKDNDAIEAVRIGNQRIELLKQYGILERS